MPYHLTRSLFLRSVALCYSMAFLSLYPQIEGLYGPKGLLPAKPTLEQLPDNFASSESSSPGNILLFFKNFHPNVLKVLPNLLGLSVELTMDLLCIVGALLGLMMVVNQSWNNKFNFILLRLGYQSLYSVGQTFLWFQWDILLLETGFLCIVVAPFWNGKVKTRPWDRLNLFLVRWLLFRMMFSSGVVKLLSQCPAWWGLTAMPVHYESQCLPTWLSWYAFQLPSTIHKLSVISTYIIEIPLVLFFFAPTKNLKQFSFWMQVLLMGTIMATGNYNFFNLLYIALCFSLFDDTWIRQDTSERSCWGFEVIQRLAGWTCNVLSYLMLILGCVYSFVKLENDKVWLSINFNMNDFQKFVALVGVESVTLAIFIFVAISIQATFGVVSRSRGIVKLFTDLIALLCYIGLGLLLICLSVPVYLRGMGVSKYPTILSSQIKLLAADLDHHNIAHSYGLFRSMTGIGGRPEVIVEGANSMTGPWKEYHFRYKPGKLEGAPKFLWPHQPRLDWQMWFAALGSYQRNPWFLSLIYRLLQNEQSVLELIDQDQNPYVDKPPKYMRAQLYHYHFTDDTNATNYWQRELVREYIPAVKLEDLDQILIQLSILGSNGQPVEDVSSNKDMEKVLIKFRSLIKQIPHHALAQSTLWALIPLFSF